MTLWGTRSKGKLQNETFLPKVGLEPTTTRLKPDGLPTELAFKSDIYAKVLYIEDWRVQDQIELLVMVRKLNTNITSTSFCYLLFYEHVDIVQSIMQFSPYTEPISTILFDLANI